MEADYLRNRQAWDAASDTYQAEHHAQLARHPEAWGIWSLPERELQLLGDVCGKDVLEYGCGAAQWSIALAKHGARCTALDNSARQLAHAHRAVQESGVEVRLVHGNAEATAFGDGTFDVVFCDHGAMTFAPPELTIPEVARIARDDAVFAFSLEHPLHAAAWSDDDDAPSRVLQRSYFELDRVEDPQDGMVSFVRTVAGYVALLAAAGFAIEKLLEPRPPADAVTTYRSYVSIEWARAFPAELMIRARRLPRAGLTQ